MTLNHFSKETPLKFFLFKYPSKKYFTYRIYSNDKQLEEPNIPNPSPIKEYSDLPASISGSNTIFVESVVEDIPSTSSLSNDKNETKNLTSSLSNDENETKNLTSSLSAVPDISIESVPSTFSSSAVPNISIESVPLTSSLSNDENETKNLTSSLSAVPDISIESVPSTFSSSAVPNISIESVPLTSSLSNDENVTKNLTDIQLIESSTRKISSSSTESMKNDLDVPPNYLYGPRKLFDSSSSSAGKLASSSMSTVLPKKETVFKFIFNKINISTFPKMQSIFKSYADCFDHYYDFRSSHYLYMAKNDKTILLNKVYDIQLINLVITGDNRLFDLFPESERISAKHDLQMRALEFLQQFIPLLKNSVHLHTICYVRGLDKGSNMYFDSMRGVCQKIHIGNLSKRLHDSFHRELVLLIKFDSQRLSLLSNSFKLNCQRNLNPFDFLDKVIKK